MVGPETIIRENESQENLWDSKMNETEKSAVIKIMEEAKSIDKNMDKLNKTNVLNPIIMNHFTFYNKNFDQNTGTFVETKKEATKDKIEAQKNVEMFYGSLLQDLRSQYESLSYGKEWDQKKIDEVLQLASFYIDLLSWTNDAGFVRIDKTPQQTEEKFKFALRNLPDVKWNDELPVIESNVKKDIPWYVLSETRYETKNSLENTTEWRYRLPMADLWKEAMNANFADLIEKLNKEWIKITGYEITGLASTVNYSDNKAIQVWGQEFLVKDNTTLADGRSRLAQERLKTNFWDKMVEGCTSNISFKTDVGKDVHDYNDPAHPEYKEWSVTPEWRQKLDEIFGPYQGVDIKVNYYVEEKTPKYIYKGENSPMTKESYNVAPKTELLIKDENNTYIQYEVSGRKLDQFNPEIKWWVVNTKIWDDKKEAMFGSNGVVQKRFNEYMALSKNDPVNYPPVVDIANDVSWIDKIQRTNALVYGKGEIVQKTPIMNLDLSNPVHKGIYEEMKSKGIINKEWMISNDKTDKYISEYMENRMKQYIKDGISNMK